MTEKKIAYIPLKDRPPTDQPRERLWQSGADKLSNAELLAILIRTGTTGRSAVQVAEDLLSRSGSIQDLAKFSTAEIKQVKGMGVANTSSIAAAFELGRRSSQPILKDSIYLKTVEDVVEYFNIHYGVYAPEKFVAFYISRQHRLVGHENVATGGSNAVVVNPQRVFKNALLCDAKAVILAHNHPGGSTKPSPYDISLTEDLKKAGELFRIPVVDHIIVTEKDSLSFAEKGIVL
jgi:DNA repair protein RadC